LFYYLFTKISFYEWHAQLSFFNHSMMCIQPAKVNKFFLTAKSILLKSFIGVFERVNLEGEGKMTSYNSQVTNMICYEAKK